MLEPIEPLLEGLATLSFNEKFENILIEAKFKDLFLFLGKTGSGKSTITNYLLGRKIVLKRNMETGNLIARLCDLSVRHPKNAEEFEQQLENWKIENNRKTHGADNILFIFLPDKEIWKGYLMQAMTKKIEEKIIEENSEFEKELKKIISEEMQLYDNKNMQLYDDSHLYSLLNAVQLFDNYEEKRISKRLLAKTSADGKSCTKYPGIYENDFFVWADCPGYADTNDSVHRMNASLSIQRLVKNANKVKGIMAVIDWHDVTSGRYESVIQLAIFFGTFFTKLEEVPIIFLVNKCGGNAITKKTIVAFMKKRIEEKKQEYIEENNKISEGRGDNKKLKEIRYCTNIFGMILDHLENVIILDLESDKSRDELSEMAKKQLSSDKDIKDLFEFKIDNDRIAIGYEIDKAASKWINYMDEYKILTKILDADRDTLKAKKELLNSHQLVNSIRVDDSQRDKRSALKAQLDSFKTQNKLIKSQYKSLVDEKDLLQKSISSHDEECKSLEISQKPIILCTVSLHEKNNKTQASWWKFWVENNISFEVIYDNSDKHAYDKIMLIGNVDFKKLEEKKRTKYNYEGKYILKPGEEVDGSIQFTIPEKDYKPTQLKIKANQASIERSKNRVGELNGEITKLIPTIELLEKFPEELEDNSLVTIEDYERKITELAKFFSQLKDQGIEREVDELEMKVKNNIQRQETLLKMIEGIEKLIKIIQRLASSVGGPENISNSEIPYRLLTAYKEFCDIRQPQKKYDQKEMLVENIEFFPEKAFIDKIFQSKPDVTWINSIKDLKNLCEKNINTVVIKGSFDSYKLHAYLHLCKAYLLNDSGRKPYISIMFENFSSAVKKRPEAENFLIDLASRVICQEISSAVIEDGDLAQLIKGFFDVFPAAKQEAFPLLVVCAKIKNKNLIQYLIKDHEIDPSIRDVDNYHLFDYVLADTAIITANTKKEIIDLLLSLGVRFTLPTKPLRFSALHYMVRHAEINSIAGIGAITGIKGVKKDDLLVRVLKGIENSEKQKFLLTICQGKTLLHYIVNQANDKNSINSQKAILKCFFSKKSKPHFLVLAELIKVAGSSLLEFVLDRCKIKEIPNIILPDGHTLFSLAVSLNKADILNLLISFDKSLISHKFSLQLNKAVRTFLGNVSSEGVQQSGQKLMPNASNSSNCLNYNAWYDPLVFEYMLPLIENNAHCIYYSFKDEHASSNTVSFEWQFEKLRELSDKLVRPAFFIAKEPGANNHFICGLYFEGRLLLINPLGISESDIFFEQLAALKTQYNKMAIPTGKSNNFNENNQLQKNLYENDPDNNNNNQIIKSSSGIANNKLMIWLSSNRIQNRQFEEDSSVSCGAIVLELAIFILKSKNFQEIISFMKSLKEVEPTLYKETAYYGCSISEILPLRLQNLVRQNIKTEYQEEIIHIRKHHCNLLMYLPLQLASLTGEMPNDYLNQHCLNSPIQYVMNRLIYDKCKIDEVLKEKEGKLLYAGLKEKWYVKELQRPSDIEDSFFLNKLLLTSNQISMLKLALLSEFKKETLELLIPKIYPNDLANNKELDLLYDVVDYDPPMFEFIWDKLNVIWKEKGIDVAALLIEKKHHVTEYNLFQYLIVYCIENIKFFLEKDSIINVGLLSQKTGDGDNFIHLAVRQNDDSRKALELVFQHLKAKNKLFAISNLFWSQNREGKTPLQLAKIYGVENLINDIASEAFIKKLNIFILSKYPGFSQKPLEQQHPFLRNLFDRLGMLLLKRDSFNLGDKIRNVVLYPSSHNLSRHIENYVDNIVTKFNQIKQDQIDSLIRDYQSQSYAGYDTLLEEIFLDTSPLNLIDEHLQRTELKEEDTLKTENAILKTKLQQMTHVVTQLCQLTLKDTTKAQGLARQCLSLLGETFDEQVIATPLSSKEKDGIELPEYNL